MLIFKKIILFKSFSFQSTENRGISNLKLMGMASLYQKKKIVRLDTIQAHFVGAIPF
ncbi:hypothetical protein IKE_05909 [Bacillus cereus VD196]|uniref:Uncharacterized protein n=1 Tax=Bacillus cereus VD196 TaxID=1053243 RepID=A0A9W5PYE2_BACCE|nr:hypothetical protein IKG_05557 [Bacillus cereus VD200]EOO61397.1 hypothetical protein IKE_05909 [Bacillus cereus VD196]